VKTAVAIDVKLQETLRLCVDELMSTGMCTLAKPVLKIQLCGSSALATKALNFFGDAHVR
jgi:hypothetical protein